MFSRPSLSLPQHLRAAENQRVAIGEVRPGHRTRPRFRKLGERWIAVPRERLGVQRRADALVQMATRSAAMPADAVTPRPLVTVVAGYGAFSTMCELADGTVVAPHHVVPWLSDADIERIVFDGPSLVRQINEALCR